MKKIFSVILLTSLFACSDSDASKAASTSTTKSDDATESAKEAKASGSDAVMSKVQGEKSSSLAIDTAVSSLSWFGWEGPKSNNHNHYGTMKFLDGKIKLSPFKENTIESGEFTLSLSSIFVEDLKGSRKNTLKKHLLASKFFNADLFPNIKVRIVSYSQNTNKVEIDFLGKKVYANVPIKLTQNKDKFFAKTATFAVDFSELNIKGFQPNKSDPNESISPVIEFSLDLAFNKI